MTDINYVIKELEEHLETNNGFDKNHALKVLYIINHQNTEIEKLKEDHDKLAVELDKAEYLNEQLGNDVDIKLDYIYELEEKLAKAKQEAYKELAEELKRYCSDMDSDNINEPTVRILWDAEETIDDVVKELVEENK